MDGVLKIGARRKLEMLFRDMDFSPVAREIEANRDLFDAPIEQDFRRNFKKSPFKDSPCVICRMTYDKLEMEGDAPTEEELIKHLVDKGVTNTNAADVETYELFPQVYQAVMWLAGMVKAEQVGRVIVARLNPGGHIKAHKDYGPYHDFYDRFHLCISGAGCYFRCGRETVKMLPGEVWWFRNNDEHEVHNDSDRPRDHVVVDLKLKGDKNVFRLGGDGESVPEGGPGGDPGGALEGAGTEPGQGAAGPSAGGLPGQGGDGGAAGDGPAQAHQCVH